MMTTAPVVVQVLEGEDAIQRYRDVMGATNPEKAAPGTIRKDFALSMGENSIPRLRRAGNGDGGDRPMVLRQRDGRVRASPVRRSPEPVEITNLMARSTTRAVLTAPLATDKELASLLLRLMMSVNDLTMAHNALVKWAFSEDRRENRRKDGGMLYYGRMQSGHIYEALLIIKEIAKTPKLRVYIERCDFRTAGLFSKLEGFIIGPDQDLLMRIRNNASFHYDGKLAIRYLEEIVREQPDHVSLYTLGTETLDWHFELSDLILDMIVTKGIFKLSSTRIFRRICKAYSSG